VLGRSCACFLDQGSFWPILMGVFESGPIE
jgi:hypothetical protein